MFLSAAMFLPANLPVYANPEEKPKGVSHRQYHTDCQIYGGKWSVVSSIFSSRNQQPSEYIKFFEEDENRKNVLEHTSLLPDDFEKARFEAGDDLKVEKYTVKRSGITKTLEFHPVFLKGEDKKEAEQIQAKFEALLKRIEDHKKGPPVSHEEFHYDGMDVPEGEEVPCANTLKKLKFRENKTKDLNFLRAEYVIGSWIDKYVLDDELRVVRATITRNGKMEKITVDWESTDPVKSREARGLQNNANGYLTSILLVKKQIEEKRKKESEEKSEQEKTKESEKSK